MRLEIKNPVAGDYGVKGSFLLEVGKPRRTVPTKRMNPND
jgi:hypothetical protein